MYHFANGHCYEGSWHEGRRQGLGVYTFRSGDRKCGEWDSGNLIHPLPSVTHKILGSVQVCDIKYIILNYSFIFIVHLEMTILCSHLLVLNMKAARKTAENAINLRRVDEQVNKATVFANKAATAARVAAVKAVQNRMDGKFCDTLV